MAKNLFLVTYDLDNASRAEYKTLLDDLDDVSDMRKLGRSSYAVETDLEDTALFELLEEKALDKKDRLYIIPIISIEGSEGAKRSWVEKRIPPDQIGQFITS